MTGYINRLNYKQYGEKRVHRIMQMLGVRSIIRPKRKKYQQSNPETVAGNVLKRDFNASRPNEKWAADVTEFKWYEGPVVHKLYFSAIPELYDRFIVGYVISLRNDNELVFSTFNAAVQTNPDAKPLFLSDCGFQYTSRVFQCRLAEQGMPQSMSRVGHCIDNVPTEDFWRIVKAEMQDLRRKFTSEEELRSAIEATIPYYNEGRYQARFGFRAPAEIRTASLGTANPAQYPISENRRIQKYRQRYVA